MLSVTVLLSFDGCFHLHMVQVGKLVSPPFRRASVVSSSLCFGFDRIGCPLFPVETPVLSLVSIKFPL